MVCNSTQEWKGMVALLASVLIFPMGVYVVPIRGPSQIHFEAFTASKYCAMFLPVVAIPVPDVGEFFSTFVNLAGKTVSMSSVLNSVHTNLKVK